MNNHTTQQPIHKTFGLPKSYRTSSRVDGDVWLPGQGRPQVLQLRRMSSTTPGQAGLYAQSTDYGPWIEISKSDFVAGIRRIAESISINP